MQLQKLNVKTISRPALENPVVKWIEASSTTSTVLYLGEGGNGKTTIKNKIINDILSKHENIYYSHFDLGEFSTLEHFLWQLRDQIVTSSDASQVVRQQYTFERFDFCIDVLWNAVDSLTTRSHEAAQRRFSRRISKGLEFATEVVSSERLNDAFTEAAKQYVSTTVSDTKIAKHLVRPILDAARRSAILARYPELNDLKDYETSDLRSLLIRFFWDDIELEQRKKNGTKFVFLLDNHHLLLETPSASIIRSGIDVVEQVFEHSRNSLNLIFSRRKPNWWVKWTKSSDEGMGYRGSTSLLEVTPFSTNEVDSFFSQFPEIDPKIITLLQDGSTSPYVLAQRVALYKSRLEKEENLDISILRGPIDDIHSKILSSWSTEEQLCIGVIAEIGNFTLSDFRAVDNYLQLKLGVFSFDSLINHVGVQELEEGKGVFTLHQYFSDAVTRRLKEILDERSYLSPEVNWITFTLLVDKSESSGGPLDQLPSFIRSVGILAKSALTEDRWTRIIEVFDQISIAIRTKIIIQDVEVIHHAYQFFRGLYILYRDPENRAFSRFLMSSMTSLVDIMSENISSYKGVVTEEFYNNCKKLVTGWVSLLQNEAQSHKAPTDFFSIWIPHWIEKIQWNIGESEHKDIQDLVANIAYAAEINQNYDNDLVEFAADKLAHGAKRNWKLSAEQKVLSHEQAMTLYSKIIDNCEDPTVMLNFCKAALFPPTGHIINESLVQKVYNILHNLIPTFGLTDDILMLITRALIRRAYHAKDRLDQLTAIKHLETAEQFLTTAISKRIGVEQFIPTRILLRVLRKKHELCSIEFDLTTQRDLIRTAAEWGIMLNSYAGSAIYGRSKNGKGEIDYITKQSTNAFVVCTRFVIETVQLFPHGLNTPLALDWLAQSIDLFISSVEISDERRSRIEALLFKVFEIDENGVSQAWKSGRVPIPLANVLARLEVERAWIRRTMRENVGANVILQLYHNWIAVAKRRDRRDIRAIIEDIVERIRVAPKTDIKTRVGLWRLARDLSITYIPDDLTIHSWICENGIGSFEQYIDDSEISSAISTVEFLEKRLASDIIGGSLLTVSKRMIRDSDKLTQNVGKRLLLEALAQCDKRLALDNDCRSDIRKAFVFSIWLSLWNDHLTSLEVDEIGPDIPRIPNDRLTRFLSGENETLAQDLLSILSLLPLQHLNAKTKCIGRIVGLDNYNGNIELLASVGGDEVRIPISLVSPLVYKKLSSKSGDDERSTDDQVVLSVDDAIGTYVYLNMLNPRGGRRYATMRGGEYVTNLFKIIFPGGILYKKDDPQFWMGGSNSLACVRMLPLNMSSFLSGGGWLTLFFSELCGIKRTALIPSYGVGGELGFRAELRHFVNNLWRDLLVEEVIGTIVTLRLRGGVTMNLQKKRTFESMFLKVFPKYTPLIIDGKSRLSTF